MGCFGRAQHAPTSPRSHTPHSLQFFLACHPKPFASAFALASVSAVGLSVPSCPSCLRSGFPLLSLTQNHSVCGERERRCDILFLQTNMEERAYPFPTMPTLTNCYTHNKTRKGRTLSLPSTGRAQHAPTNPHSLQFFYLCSTTT
jgi:hypothetical protein